MVYVEGVAAMRSAFLYSVFVCQADTRRKGGLQSPSLSREEVVCRRQGRRGSAGWEFSPPEPLLESTGGDSSEPRHRARGLLHFLRHGFFGTFRGFSRMRSPCAEFAQWSVQPAPEGPGVSPGSKLAKIWTGATAPPFQPPTPTFCRQQRMVNTA
jgi:hypothetical protein